MKLPTPPQCPHCSAVQFRLSANSSEKQIINNDQRCKMKLAIEKIGQVLIELVHSEDFSLRCSGTLGLQAFGAECKYEEGNLFDGKNPWQYACVFLIKGNGTSSVAFLHILYLIDTDTGHSDSFRCHLSKFRSANHHHNHLRPITYSLSVSAVTQCVWLL